MKSLIKTFITLIWNHFYISHISVRILKSRGFRLEEVSQFFKPPKNAQDPQNMGDIELAQSLSRSKEKRPLNAN